MMPDRDYRVVSTNPDYIATTLTWTGARMTTMTASSPYTFVKRYVPDLTSYVQTDGMVGIGAEPAYVSSQGRWFYAILDGSLLHVREIASDGTPISALLDVPSTGPAGAPLSASFAAGRDGFLYAMWSQSPGVCEWARIETSPLAATHAPVTVDCAAPRLADLDDGALAIFESGGGLVAMELHATGAQSAEWIDAGTDVRLLRDGNYWVAYRRDGQLALARYDDTGYFVRVPLVGASLLDIHGFELVNRDGTSYLFVAGGERLWWAQL
jgi:hypothetical protein